MAKRKSKKKAKGYLLPKYQTKSRVTPNKKAVILAETPIRDYRVYDENLPDDLQILADAVKELDKKRDQNYSEYQKQSRIFSDFLEGWTGMHIDRGQVNKRNEPFPDVIGDLSYRVKLGGDKNKRKEHYKYKDDPDLMATDGYKRWENSRNKLRTSQKERFDASSQFAARSGTTKKSKDTTFLREADRMKSWYEKNNIPYDIHALYGNGDTTKLKEILGQEDIGDLVVMGHSGSKIAGIELENWNRFLGDSNYEHCVFGSCFGDKLVDSGLGDVKNLSHTTNSAWVGVNPRAETKEGFYFPNTNYVYNPDGTPVTTHKRKETDNRQSMHEYGGPIPKYQMQGRVLEAGSDSYLAKESRKAQTKLKTYEKEVNNLLEDPKRTRVLTLEDIITGPNRGVNNVNEDALRHGITGYRTAKAIKDRFPNWVPDILSSAGGSVGATLLGLGHEMAYPKQSDTFEDFYNFTLEEAKQDAMNNYYGSRHVGSDPEVARRNITNDINSGKYYEGRAEKPQPDKTEEEAWKQARGRTEIFLDATLPPENAIASPFQNGGVPKYQNGTDHIKEYSNIEDYTSALTARNDSLQLYNEGLHNQFSEKKYNRGYSYKTSNNFIPFEDTPLLEGKDRFERNDTRLDSTEPREVVNSRGEHSIRPGYPLVDKNEVFPEEIKPTKFEINPTGIRGDQYSAVYKKPEVTPRFVYSPKSDSQFKYTRDWNTAEEGKPQGQVYHNDTWVDYYQNGGSIPKYQDGADVAPYITSDLDKYNSRKIAYDDSTKAYNMSAEEFKRLGDVFGSDPSFGIGASSRPYLIKSFEDLGKYSIKNPRDPLTTPGEVDMSGSSMGPRVDIHDKNTIPSAKSVGAPASYYDSSITTVIHPSIVADTGRSMLMDFYPRPTQPVKYNPTTQAKPVGNYDNPDIRPTMAKASGNYNNPDRRPGYDIKMPDGTWSKEKYIKQYGEASWDKVNKERERAEDKYQNGGRIRKYQNDGRVYPYWEDRKEGNVNDWLITKQELADYQKDYSRMTQKCRTGGCLERASMYYDQNISGLLETPAYNTIKENSNISASNPEDKDYRGPHRRFEEYEHSADSWDIHGLLQEKGAKQIYAHPLESNSKISQSWSKFRKKPIEEQEQYWRDLNIPLGSIVGMGYSGGVGTRGTKSYNKEKGLVPSNHSGMVAGYDETGLPYIYDWDKIVPITETRYEHYPITNITAPKEIQQNTFAYLSNREELEDAYTPLKLNISDRETNSDYDPDELDPFIKALESYKKEISNALGIDFALYDELAKRAVATALSETEGGDDTTIRWMKGVPIPSYITDKIGIGNSTGITQINEDLIWARVGTEEQRKGNRMPAKLNALNIREKDYDPWHPTHQAKATIAFLYDNLEVGRKNLKKGVNKETGSRNSLDLPDEQVGYYQWFQPNLMNNGIAWGESEKVRKFAEMYSKVSIGDLEETPVELSPPASDSRQYGGNVEQDPLYTSLLNAFQNGGEVEQRRGVRENPDGSVSSHLMRAEYVDGRGWVGFPSLFQDSKPYADDSENWIDMSEEEDWMKVYKEAEKRGEVYDFGDDREAALRFGEGSWKDSKVEMQNGGEVLPEELPHQEIVSFPTEREPAGDPRVPRSSSVQDYYTNLENTPVPKTLSKKYKIWESSYKSPMGLAIESYKNIYDIQAFFNSGDWKENFESIEKYRKSSHPMLGTTDPKTNTFIPSEENLNTNEEIASHIDINDIPVNFKKVERIPINPDGFAPGSATEFADKVVIPSGNITMKDMQEPILANGEMLMPGDEAQFDTDYVVEEKLPKAQDGLKVEGNWNDPVLDPSSNYSQVKRQKEVEDFARQVIKKDKGFNVHTQEGRDDLTNPLAYLPGSGEALDLMSTAHHLREGNYGEAAMYGAGLVLPIVPGAFVKKVAGPVVDKAKPYINKLKSFFKASPTPVTKAPNIINKTNFNLEELGLTSDNMIDIAENTRKRLLTDKFIENNMKTTGRTRKEVVEEVEKHVKEFEAGNLTITQNPNVNYDGIYKGDGELGLNIPNWIKPSDADLEMYPFMKKHEIDKRVVDNVSGTLEHEINHLMSDSKGPYMIVGKDNKLANVPLYDNYPTLKLADDANTPGGIVYQSVAPEQQVRLRKSIRWLEDHADLKMGGEITDEHVKKLGDALKNFGQSRKYPGSEEMVGGGKTSDIRELLGHLDLSSVLEPGEAAFLSEIPVGSKKWIKTVKEALNKTYGGLTAAAVGGTTYRTLQNKEE